MENNTNYKKKLGLSNKINNRKDNTIETMKQNLKTMRFKAKGNRQALQVSLKRTASYKVQSKVDVKEMLRHNNTIKSLKEKVEKLRLEAAQNTQSMTSSLNRTVVAERNNKPLVQ